MSEDLTDEVFERLVGEADEPGGLSAEAEAHEPGNFLRHVGALSASKIADGLVDPKLVLSWLLTHLGAGAGLTGLLVPVREAGALLPQLFTAGAIRALPRRKWAWTLGAVGQAAATVGIVSAGLSLSGPVAGAVIVALLAVLAISRSVCSVSYKDVLAKTVGKTRRGTAKGVAGTVSSAGVIVFALALLVGLADRIVLVIGALCVAVAGWALAAALMAMMREEAQAADSAEVNPLSQLALLRDRPQLARFIAVRLALVGSALAPPYLVMLASGGAGAAFEALGALVLASSVAAFVSSYVWGRLSDRSARRVLILSGLAGAAAMALALGLHWAGLGQRVWAMPVALFLLMIAYHGVRSGRSTYLVDMAPKDDRPAYTAVANTVVGLGLLAGGAAVAGIAALSVPLAIGVFAAFSLLGSALALGLKEVEQDG